MSIEIGTYVWERGGPIPKCDSCKKNDATKKLYTEDVGIRLCDPCTKELKRKLK